MTVDLPTEWTDLLICAWMLTGKNPQRAGVPGNAGQDLSRTSGLPPSEYTLAEMFKDQENQLIYTIKNPK